METMTLQNAFNPEVTLKVDSKNISEGRKITYYNTCTQTHNRKRLFTTRIFRSGLVKASSQETTNALSASKELECDQGRQFCTGSVNSPQGHRFTPKVASKVPIVLKVSERTNYIISQMKDKYKSSQGLGNQNGSHTEAKKHLQW